MVSQIEQTSSAFRAQLLAGDARALEQMRAAYQPVRDRLVALVDDLVAQIGETPIVRSTDVLKLDRAQTLLAQVEEELAALASFADPYLTAAQRAAAGLASAHALGLVAAQDPSIAASFNRLTPRAVESIVGRLSDGSPLRDWLDALGPETGETIRAALVDAVATGTNPNGVARALAAKVDLAGFRLLTTTRSAILDAYRSAALASYRENADVVSGWEWISAHQSRTCLACLALDGRRFPLTVEFQPSHRRCRCSAIPVLKGARGTDRQTGQEWFEAQPESVRNAMVPKGAREGFANGTLALDDFVRLDRDPKWGDSYREGSLTDAIARAAARERRAA